MTSYHVVRRENQPVMKNDHRADTAIIEQGKGGERTICLCDGREALRIVKALKEMEHADVDQ